MTSLDSGHHPRDLASFVGDGDTLDLIDAFGIDGRVLAWLSEDSFILLEAQGRTLRLRFTDGSRPVLIFRRAIGSWQSDYMEIRGSTIPAEGLRISIVTSALSRTVEAPASGPSYVRAEGREVFLSDGSTVRSHARARDLARVEAEELEEYEARMDSATLSNITGSPHNSPGNSD